MATTTTTITEALAELKLIDKKVSSKREAIKPYLSRLSAMVDPLGDQGGSRKVIASEIQAIYDLLNRRITIREMINRANNESVITLEGTDRTVANWLTWRREVYPTQLVVCREMLAGAQSARQNAVRQGVGIVPAEKEATAPAPEKPTVVNELLINVSERQLQRDIEKLETMNGQLDGKLSLHNATVQITY